jgi:ubiquitin-conjugating enzyme (huntingtin interacting protein 2)
MSDRRHRKVTKEIAQCNHDETTNIKIELIDDSPFHLRGSFRGPQDSPYEGGHFEVDIVVPIDYPFRPPKVRFITKVYHPNIYASGVIDLDILRDQWSPSITLSKLLISLQSFLCTPEVCSPEPDDPHAASVAKQYASVHKSFEDTARNWTRIYARRSSQT